MTTIYATSGQTNLTKRLHRHRTWTVQSYSPGGANMHPHLTHASWATPVHIPNGISIDSAVFAQLTTEGPYTLQWAAHFSLKISLAHEGSEPPSNTCFLGPTRLHNPNSISLGSALFAGLTSVTD